MSRAQSEDAEVVGCIVKDPSKESDTPCQDAYSTQGFSGGRFAIAVGDGLGSEPLSHVGAKAATSAAVSALADYVESLGRGTPIEEESAAQVLENAFEEALDAVRDKAETRGESIARLGTTLLAVVGGPGGLAGAAVGDGGIVYTGEDGHEPLVLPEWEIIDFPRDSLTIPLTSGNRNRSYRFGFESSVQQVAVFSDGLSQHAWDNTEENYVNSPFFDNISNDITKSASSQEASRILEDAFQSENFRRFKDDKTLAVGRLPGWEGLPSSEATDDSPDSEPSEGPDMRTVEHVEENSHRVVLHVSTQGTELETLTLIKPVDWDLHEGPAKLLGNEFDIPPGSFDELIGSEIPCKPDQEGTGLTLDTRAITAKGRSYRVETADMVGIELGGDADDNGD